MNARCGVGHGMKTGMVSVGVPIRGGMKRQTRILMGAVGLLTGRADIAIR